MRHYFLNSEGVDDETFSFSHYFLNDEYTFFSSSDVFSKDKIDYGTSVLLKTIIEQINLSGRVLDVGCGYGIIGIVLNKYFPDVLVTMIDVNKKAVELAKKNAELHKCKCEIWESNLYENVKGEFEHIVSNPPIKAGKENLFNLVNGASNILVDGGTITLVIKKKHGMESLKQHMTTLFKKVEILEREKGYFILHGVK